MNSLLCNWFDDCGFKIIDGLGQTGLIIFIVVFAVLICFTLYNIFLAQIFKPRADRKFKIKWVQIIFTVILVLFTIWFCTLLNKI